MRTVAADRDRYGVQGRRVLLEPKNVAQKLDFARAEQAIRRARANSAEAAARAHDGRIEALEQHGRVLA